VQVRRGYFYGPEVDWWSVGCVIYKMMTGDDYQRVYDYRNIYPRHLTEDAISIMEMVRINCDSRNTSQSL
jgi:serine/threonine protein kinase